MEEWRAIDGFPYSVSDLGRIRRDRPARGGQPGIRHPTISTKGYACVRLHSAKKTRYAGVHQLVAEAFLSAPPFHGLHVNHKDFNKLNNVPSNLEWVTPEQNNAHSRNADRVVCPNGEDNHAAKLTWARVDEIRARRANRETLASLADAFGVAESLIHGVVHGKRWVRR